MSVTIPVNQQTNIGKKYSITMTEPNVQSVNTQNEITTIVGTAVFTLQGANFSGQNRVIPDFKGDIRGCLELSSESNTIELESEISFDEAKKQILDYLNLHEHARTSDIIIDLCLDPALVIEALDKLKEEDVVEGKDVQPSADQKQPTE
jgi:hypothetical protein